MLPKMSDMDKQRITSVNIDRIIEIAWEDRTPFEAIELQFGLSDKEVVDLMRLRLTASSFKRWRKRNYTFIRSWKNSRDHL